MKLVDLKHQIEVIEKLHSRDFADLEVRVVTNDRSIGKRSSVEVADISAGFDWDKGDVLITTKTPIKKEPICQTTDKLKTNIGGRNVHYCKECDNVVSKDDKYCKHCGKRFTDN